MKYYRILLSALILSGCAVVPLSHDQCNATKFPTAHEHEQCLLAATKYEEELNAQADRRLIRMDKQVAALNTCDLSPNHAIVEMQRGKSQLPSERVRRRTKREYGVAFTHQNISSSLTFNDWACMTSQEIQEMLRRAGF